MVIKNIAAWSVAFLLVGCATQTPFAIREPAGPPLKVSGDHQILGLAVSPIPSPTALYGDPTLGYVQNIAQNKIIKAWWVASKTEGRPLHPPDFELAPGWVREFYLPPGKNWLYIEGYYPTQRGEVPAGWNVFEVTVASHLQWDGHYGWRVVITDWHFRY